MRQIGVLQWEEIKQRIQRQRIIFEGKGPNMRISELGVPVFSSLNQSIYFRALSVLLLSNKL